MLPKLTLEQIPPTYSRCFLADCPLAETCLRHQAGLCLNADISQGFSVFPNARTETGCKHFQPIRLIRAAWGFDAIFAEVKSKDETILRNQIKDYLGDHSAYYRYHNGKRKLTPQQQEWIINLFRKYGYQDPLEFDHYTEIYDFS